MNQLELSSFKLVDWSITKDRFRWMALKVGKATLHWFPCFGTQIRLLYPIMWHENITVASLVLHSICTQSDSNWSLHCSILHTVTSGLHCILTYQKNNLLR